MRESLLKRAADWFMGKAPDKNSRNRTIQSLRDEFDWWINCSTRKRTPIKQHKKKNAKTFTGKLSNAKRKATYQVRCQEIYGGK